MSKILHLSSISKKIILLFLSWRIILTLALIISSKFIPLGNIDKFLGGGPINYYLAPELFAWANFDGEHYLSIAIFGYKSLEQAFFPVYPLLISIFAKPFSTTIVSSLINSTIVGLIISHLSLLSALFVLFKLIRIDFSEKISLLTIILILIFPTSFYFGAVYNEALFLLLSVLTFYNARKGRWFLAGIFGMLASATRVFGIFLLPALIIEAFIQKEKFSKSFWILLAPLGLLGYMFYQYLTVGDLLAFYNLQDLVGVQRQSGITLLPQVYFRYIKMLLTVDITSPLYQTLILEFITGIIFLILPVYGYFKKIRISYLIYVLMAFLISTVQGSLTSVPRYVIVFFPSFMALAIFFSNLPKVLKIAIVIISILLLFIETSLFLRGYWIA